MAHHINARPRVHIHSTAGIRLKEQDHDQRITDAIRGKPPPSGSAEQSEADDEKAQTIKTYMGSITAPQRYRNHGERCDTNCRSVGCPRALLQNSAREEPGN